MAHLPECQCVADTDPWCGKCGCLSNPHKPGLRANGNRCPLKSVDGFFRCHMHRGTSAPAVYKAREALALLRMPAIEQAFKTLDFLESVIHQYTGNTCLSCGRPRGDSDETEAAVKAAGVTVKLVQMVLDRTELGPKAYLELKQSDGVLELDALTDLELEQLHAAAAQYQAIKEKIMLRLTGKSIDTTGVVV